MGLRDKVVCIIFEYVFSFFFCLIKFFIFYIFLRVFLSKILFIKYEIIENFNVEGVMLFF